MVAPLAAASAQDVPTPPADRAAPRKAPTAVAVFAHADDPGAADLAGRFEIELTRALIGRGLDVADFDTLFPPPAPASTAEGDTLMQEGMEAFNNLDPDTAIQKFTDAATFYASHPLYAPPEKMAAAYVALGATAQLNGRPERAQEAFRRALVLAPNIEPDPLFGGDAKEALEQVRMKMEAAPRGTISVQSQPQGARVLLDGKELGLTPVPPKSDVPIGRHHVVLRRPGYQSFAAYPDLTEEKPAELRPVLEPTEGMARALEAADGLLTPEAFAAPTVSPDANALAASLRARFLVMSRVSQKPHGTVTAAVQAWDTLTGNKLDGLSVDLAQDDWRSTDQLAEQLRRWITHPPPVASVEEKGGEPVFKKWWFWTAVGVVAAGAATTVAVSQSGRHRPNFVVGLP